MLAVDLVSETKRCEATGLCGGHWWGKELFAGDLAVAGCVQTDIAALESLTGHWSDSAGDVHGEDHGELVAVHEGSFGFE
jgi:hypothetical protein